MAVGLEPSVIRAINRFAQTNLGRRYAKWARENHSMSGKKLMAKTVAGEFGGRSTKSGRNVVSSAGARGPAQFIPSTREAYIKQYGVDPWKNDFSAMKGMAIHHMGTGVAGYNPGMPTYTSYILGQKLDKGTVQALRTGRAGGGGGRAGGGRGRPGVAPRSSPVGFAQSDVAGLAALLTQQSQPQQPVAASALPAPAHSAGVRLPKGYQAPSGGGGGGQPESSIEEAISQIQQLVGSKQLPEVTGGRTFPGRAPERGTRGGRAGGGRSSAPSLRGVQISKDGKGGARQVAKWAGRDFVTSGERTPAENAAVGGAENSDHLTTKRGASAVDMKYGTGRAVAKRLGIKNWRPGTYDRYPVTIKGRKYSVQILENVEGHFDHTHLGVQRIR